MDHATPTLFGAPTGFGGASADVGSRSRAATGPEAPGGPLSVGQSFGPRYRILKLLGVGGMGAVYQAWDQELGVAVALKVVQPEAAADPAATRALERRFKQELLLARKVTHKNVVRIHDLGEIDGIKYITMSYIDGVDLAAVLDERRKLDVPAALAIARDIVAGLEAAHEAGIVHRDLKPANVMIEAGRALIMDFGIARSTSPVGQQLLTMAGGTTVGFGHPAPKAAGSTMIGAVLGTIEYMAPEQARGEPADQRADIYAFGLMLYDMLLGRRCASGATTPLEDLQRRLTAAPPPPRALDPAIPDALDRIIMRCVQPAPAARYQTTAELAGALAALDERGQPKRVPVRFGVRLIAASIATVVALVAGTWWFTRPIPPPKPHDPVSVVIADLQNRTGDPAFDGTLEPVLKLALEGAGFITAYDRTQIRRSLGVRPPEKLDERAAREIAIKQGLSVVVSGTVDRDGSGYKLAVKAAQAVTGNVIGKADARVGGRDQVVPAATTLAVSVRKSLGDDTSDSAQRFAMETLSTTSLDVVREYAAAMDAVSNGAFDEARRRFANAVALDPNFGLGYAGMAMMSQNLGQRDAAQKYIAEAVRHVDHMTERERYRTRGLYYMVTSDYQACVKEYGDLLARFAADAAARNNLALCSTQLRNMPRAIDEMQRAVQILPKRTLYRVNLGLYASYGSDFSRGEREARAAQELGSPLALLPLAFAQVGLGRLDDAVETYRQFGQVNAAGASYMASGLGDIAAYEGRYADAVRLFEDGAAADLKAGESDRAAAKIAAVAHTQLLRGDTRSATAAADRALTISNAVKIRFLAARVFAESGETAKARALASSLASELVLEPQAYAKIVNADIALNAREPRQAIELLIEANGRLDTWIGHFDLGRAYLDAGAFTQADSEFDRCLQRRGEALALFLDEEPTYRYLPSVYYYQGRVLDGLKSPGAAKSYRTYLDIRQKAREDPLLAEARRRAAR